MGAKGSDPYMRTPICATETGARTSVEASLFEWNATSVGANDLFSDDMSAQAITF